MSAVIPKPQFLRCRIGFFAADRLEVVNPDTGGFETIRGIEQLEKAMARLADARADSLRFRLRKPGVSGVVHPPLIAPPEGRGRESYALEISPDGIMISAAGPAGAFYAAQTLKQLVQITARGMKWSCLTIRDWPSAPIRSALFDLRQWVEAGTCVRLDYLKSIVDRMSSGKLNTLVYYDEFSSIKLDSFPELAAAGALTKDEVKTLVAYAAERFVEIVPVFNSFGHWSSGMAAHHRDLSEGGHGTNFCAADPRAKAFLEKLLPEVCALFPARRFSPGCDEVEALGECPACRKIGAEAAWVRHVNMVCGILTRQGKQPFIWTDYINFGPNQTPRWSALDKLDKNIELAYWFYPSGTGLPGLREMARRAPGRRLHLYSAVVTMENVFPAWQCRLANVEDHARLLKSSRSIRRRTVSHTTCAWCLGRTWPEMSWFGVLYHADLAWNDRVINRRDFQRRFDRVFLGVDTDEISGAIMDLARCNVFDNGGGFPFRADSVNLMYGAEDLALDRLSRAEVLARIATIPARAARVKATLAKWERRLGRNRLFFDSLKLAAERFETFARRVLLLEECRDLYRQAYRLQYVSHWQFEPRRPADRAGVIRRLERIRRNLETMRGDIGPLRERTTGLWRASWRDPGLKEFHLDRLDDIDCDLGRLIRELKEILGNYRRGGGLVPPDRRFIFMSTPAFEAKRYV